MDAKEQAFFFNAPRVRTRTRVLVRGHHQEVARSQEEPTSRCGEPENIVNKQPQTANKRCTFSSAPNNLSPSKLSSYETLLKASSLTYKSIVG
jgi:hypothetical protein